MDVDAVKEHEIDILEAVAAVALGVALTNLYFSFVDGATAASITLLLLAVGSVLLAIATVKTVNHCETQLDELVRQRTLIEEQLDRLDPASSEEIPKDGPARESQFMFDEEEAQNPKETLDRLFGDNAD